MWFYEVWGIILSGFYYDDLWGSGNHILAFLVGVWSFKPLFRFNCYTSEVFEWQPSFCFEIPMGTIKPHKTVFMEFMVQTGMRKSGWFYYWLLLFYIWGYSRGFMVRWYMVISAIFNRVFMLLDKKNSHKISFRNLQNIGCSTQNIRQKLSHLWISKWLFSTNNWTQRCWSNSLQHKIN